MVSLILAAFALVALPLVAALIMAVINAERLERQSTILIEQSVRMARFSESLAEQLIDMERNARQYQVLGDEALLEVYQQRQARFLEILEQTAALPLPIPGESDVRALREGSQAIGQALVRFDPQSPQLGAALERFASLHDLTAKLNAASVEFVDQELQNLRETATDARQDLVWVFMLVIPIAVALALIFVILINRPIRQVERAIEGLSDDGYGSTIAVGGPPEIRDLGKRLETLRRRLAELETEKSRFLRHMSHELKTPLASLREGADLLLDGSAGELNDTQYEVAGLLRANSIELQQMILSLLDFSAWQDKTHRLQLTRVDLKALARSLADRHRLTLAARGLELNISGAAVTLQADRDKLRTALDNLLSNAVKYSPQGGNIELKTGMDDAHATLDITDEGPGIPVADRERIFVPFYQGKMPHSGPLRGTGIGLSVVRECVNAHGGEVEVKDSQRGTHIRITLPFNAAD